MDTGRMMGGFEPGVAYLIEMWLLKYDKCIYLNSDLTLCILVSFCGFQHYTRNRTRTS